MQNISFSQSNLLIFTFIISAGILAYLTGKLTLFASVAGVVIGILIYVGAGLTGLAMLAAFFVLGTAATSFKKEYKLKFRLMSHHDERRTVSQVLANAGAAAILSGLSLVLVDKNSILLVMTAASFASATSDTFSSELGNVYGRNFYNIATFEKDQRGLNGVISLEGTLFGILGSVVISLIYTIAIRWSFAFFAIMISGIAGNLLDSVLGALFERKGWLGNDAVNFLNTGFAALLALLLMQL
jgi:uncharacterized protein (TIGR00297 family)